MNSDDAFFLGGGVRRGLSGRLFGEGAMGRGFWGGEGERVSLIPRHVLPWKVGILSLEEVDLLSKGGKRWPFSIMN